MTQYMFPKIPKRQALAHQGGFETQGVFSELVSQWGEQDM